MSGGGSTFRKVSNLGGNKRLHSFEERKAVFVIFSVFAASPHFKQYSDRTDVLVDDRTGTEHPIYDVDTAILVYEDSVRGWFLDHGESLKKDQNAGFVVLQIAVSQIEGMQQYRLGESSEPERGKPSRSKDLFCEGMKRIFSLDQRADEWLLLFYKSCRCGLFHNGMTGKVVVISREFPTPIEYVDRLIEVNPNSFFDAVKNDFDIYLRELKEKKEMGLRDRFRKFSEWRIARS